MPAMKNGTILRKWLRTEHGLLRATARAVEVSNASIYKWINGQSTPTPEHQITLEAMTGGRVKSENWPPLVPAGRPRKP